MCREGGRVCIVALDVEGRMMEAVRRGRTRRRGQRKRREEWRRQWEGLRSGGRGAREARIRGEASGRVEAWWWEEGMRRDGGGEAHHSIIMRVARADLARDSSAPTLLKFERSTLNAAAEPLGFFLQEAINSSI